MRFVGSLLILVALVMVLGCGDAGPDPADATNAAAPPPPAPTPSGPIAAEEGEAPASETAAAPETEAMPADAAATAPAAAPAGTTEQAQVGVGKKGRNYGGPGMITTPIEAYFRTGEWIAFEVQIPNAMKLYKASHNNKGPKTHEEFWEVIIKENAVKLPELPEGDEFVYDPATEQLLVRHPADEQPME